MLLSNSEKLKSKRVQDAISTDARLREHKRKLNSLSKKREDLEELIPRLSATAKTAEREKHLVIDNYCNDKCTSEDLEAAKRNYDEAVNAEKRNFKLLKTLNMKISIKLQFKLRKLTRAFSFFNN